MTTTRDSRERLGDPVYDPLSFYEDPYPLYRLLRDEAPVYYNEQRDLWALSRFEDIQRASREWRVFSSGESVVLDDESELYAPGGFVDQDPPSHDRLRDVMATRFSPKSTKELEAAIRERTRKLLRPLFKAGGGDLAADLARPLPAGVICAWLGFPEEDHEQLTEWFASMLERVPGQTDLPAAAWEAQASMSAYIDAAAHDRQIRPTEDLLTVLVEAVDEGSISWDELRGMTIFLFYSGIVTTAGLISNSLLNLVEYPEQRELIVRNRGLIVTAIEELLRYDAPIQALSRITKQDVSLHDVIVPLGSRVLLIWGSANRDERRWSEPDRLDIGRERQRHVAFGEGIHHCLGAPLARLEAKVVFEELFASVASYEVVGAIERIFTPGERGLAHLPIAFN